MLLFHVLIALASVGYTTYLIASPAKSKLRVLYILVALTLASGTYLIWNNPAHMVQSCTTGLLYIGVISLGVVLVHNKLASAKSPDSPSN